MAEGKQVGVAPQAAVLREAKGPYVFVVGSDGKVAQKRITTYTQQGESWVVTDGLADGDQIVVSVVQKVRPDAPAKAVPWSPNADNNAKPQQAPAPPAADKH